MTTAVPFFKRHWQKIVALLFWLVLILTFVVYSSRNNLTPLGATRALMNALSAIPILVRGSVFIAIYTLRPLIFFPASWLTLAIGALCGPLWGIIFAVIGSNLSATLAYLVGRLFGQDVVRLEGDNVLQRYLQRMRQNSFETIFVMRLIFLPYDLVNYAAGSSGLEGGTPKFDWRILALSVAIFVGSLLVSRLVRRREASSG
jgi:uncharacterized membrane protein YdjX (TVP38/TMEM64 family)